MASFSLHANGNEHQVDVSPDIPLLDVISFEDKVAVVGTSTWEVKKGRDALQIEWEDPGNLESISQIFGEFESLTQKHRKSLSEKKALLIYRLYQNR